MSNTIYNCVKQQLRLHLNFDSVYLFITNSSFCLIDRGSWRVTNHLHLIITNELRTRILNDGIGCYECVQHITPFLKSQTFSTRMKFKPLKIKSCHYGCMPFELMILVIGGYTHYKTDIHFIGKRLYFEHMCI